METTGCKYSFDAMRYGDILTNALTMATQIGERKSDISNLCVEHKMVVDVWYYIVVIFKPLVGIGFERILLIWMIPSHTYVKPVPNIQL